MNAETLSLATTPFLTFSVFCVVILVHQRLFVAFFFAVGLPRFLGGGGVCSSAFTASSKVPVIGGIVVSACLRFGMWGQAQIRQSNDCNCGDSHVAASLMRPVGHMRDDDLTCRSIVEQPADRLADHRLDGLDGELRPRR
jgi:hypothetical protein